MTTVTTIQLPAAELHEGSIVNSCGRALYLRRYLGWCMGYHRWTYTRHEPDGTCVAQGTAEFRDGSSVPVVAVTLEGELVTP